MPRYAYPALALLLCLGSNPARADFLISFDPNTNIAPGGSGFVNVYISSDAVGGQNLFFAGFEFALTPTGPTRLEFQDSPPASSDPTFANPNYVFFNNSVAQAGNSQLGTANSVNGTNDRFVGMDFAADGLGVTVDATPKLLAMVPVTAATGLPPAPGSTFTISLVPPAAPGPSDNTGFADNVGNFSPFLSGTGTITVTATPEPSALILVGAGVGLSMLAGRWRGRASQTTP